MTRPRLLDLFCGAGGASAGYDRAGFDVVGVDVEPQPHYPFEFVQGDALVFLERMVAGGTFEWKGPGLFAAVHASPPCQANSTLAAMWNAGEHKDLIPQIRELLEAWGLPYVIENVVGAPLKNPVQLCGSYFGLGAGGRYLQRHRLFESNIALMSTPCCHDGQLLGVYGTGGGGQMTRGYKARPGEDAEALGIDWMTRASSRRRSRRRTRSTSAGI